MSLANFDCFGQNINKNDYLGRVALDLNDSAFEFRLDKVKVIGFGALHGSAKTEKSELLIVSKLVNSNSLKYYFPETDFSTAHYFNKYLSNGDEKLLEELIIQYGERVPQEKSIEMFQKWKYFRNVFKGKGVKIIGVDKIASYKFSVMHLVSLISKDSLKTDLVELINQGSTNWRGYYNTSTRESLKSFVYRFRNNQIEFLKNVSDSNSFLHIIHNLELTFERSNRENVIYENYKKMKGTYGFRDRLQFFRFGTFHIMKSDINGASTFFSKLIDNSIYSHSEVLSIQGFLTKSKVLWDVKFDDNNNVKRVISKKGFGTADYFLEYFKGIKFLKRNKVSDLTMFNLRKDSTPYGDSRSRDLITLRKLIGRSGWVSDPNKCTLDYLDYAILISRSQANTTIELLNDVD